MKTFAERLASCREAVGLSQSELARRMSLTPQAVQKWERGENIPRGKRIEKLAAELSTTIGYLLSGEGYSNVELGPNVKGMLPLISWGQAGEWTEISGSFGKDDASEWLHCPVSHSDRAFALRVRGQSMFDPRSRRSFSDGDLIFVDPEKEAVSGSLVVVSLLEGGEATFKELLVEDNKCYLKALNPDWPEPIFEITCDFKIAGVVIGKYESM